MSVQETLSGSPSVPAPDEEHWVPTPAGRLYVRVNGVSRGGRPPLMMIHGGPGGHHGAHVPALGLAADRTVILYDQLDCGRSDRPGIPANWTVERFASEVEAIRRFLGVPQLDLLGHSWGAAVAVEHAARCPATVRSLLLVSPYVSTRSWEASTAELLTGFDANVRHALWEEGATEADVRKAMGLFYARHWMRRRAPDHLADYAAGLEFNGRLYAALWGRNEARVDGALRAYDGEPRLAACPAPRLFIAGEYDEMSPAACQALAARTGGGETAVVPDAGHMVQVDNPRAYVEILRRRLQALDAL